MASEFKKGNMGRYKKKHLINGNYYTLKALMIKTGLSRRSIYYKIKAGVGIKRVCRKQYLIDGKRYTIEALMAKMGKSKRSVYYKLNAGIRTLKGISRPKHKLKAPNWQSSMFNDEHGHWKLLAKSMDTNA